MRQENEAIHKFSGVISYLNGKIVYTGVGGWGTVGTQTRAKAKGAEWTLHLLIMLRCP